MPIEKLKEQLERNKEALKKAVNDVEISVDESKTIIDFPTFVIIAVIWLLILLFAFKDFTEGHI